VRLRVGSAPGPGLSPADRRRLHVHAVPVRRAGSGHHEAAGRSDLGLKVARIGIKRFEGSVTVLERSRMITLLYSPKISTTSVFRANVEYASTPIVP
jgi:hypothetical protein